LSRLIVVHPMDPRGIKVGGIETHVRQILRHAPAGAAPLLIGVDDRGDLTVGKVSRIEFSGRPLDFLPVAHFPADEQQETARSILRSNTVRFIAGYLRHLPKLRREAVRVTSTVEVERYEIAWLARLLGRPMVLVVHNDVGDAQKQDSLTRYIWRATQATEWAAYRMADHVFTVTERLRDRALKLAPHRADRVEVMPVSIDTGIFRTVPLDTSDGALRVAYAGRLETVKDPELMFATVAELQRRTGGKIEFHYAGGSDPTRWPGFPEIEAVTLRHGPLRTEQMAAMLASAHVVLMTSHWEGMPCLMLEGLATGRPFVGPSLPQFRQVLLSPSHGRMVERGQSVVESAARWADAVMAHWDAIRAGEIVPERLNEAVQPFSVKRQIGRLHQVHAALASGHDAPPRGAKPSAA
jgi:glycosyltransferase involved in cell wall biosynthesis